MKYMLLIFLMLPFNHAQAEPSILLNQKSYVYTAFPQINPQPVHELVAIARDRWHFDGVELSFDALVNEGGSNGRQFESFIQQLAINLDAIGISKLHKDNKFELRLFVELESELVRNLDKSFIDGAIRECLHRLPIISYDGVQKVDTNVPYIMGTIIKVSTGKDSTLTKSLDEQRKCTTLKRRYRRSQFISIQASQPLKWSILEGGKIGIGSDAFEGCIQILLKR